MIVGNCQARPLAQIATTICPEVEVNFIAVVHLMKNDDNAIFEKQCKIADYIFAQRVADDYPCVFVRTNELKKKYGKRVVVWPNIYFRGYNPELIYIRSNEGKALRGPLGDYHNFTFFECWKKGLSQFDALTLYKDINYNIENYGRIPEYSLNELRKREEDCDIQLSNYIEEGLKGQRFFFTFNHPKTELLVYTARKLLNYFSISFEKLECILDAEPLGQIRPPVNPWVAYKYCFDTCKDNLWKGLIVKRINSSIVDTGNRKEYCDHEIIDIFYRIYEANKKEVDGYSISPKPVIIR